VVFRSDLRCVQQSRVCPTELGSDGRHPLSVDKQRRTHGQPFQKTLPSCSRHGGWFCMESTSVDIHRVNTFRQVWIYYHDTDMNIYQVAIFGTSKLLSSVRKVNYFWLLPNPLRWIFSIYTSAWWLFECWILLTSRCTFSEVCGFEKLSHAMQRGNLFKFSPTCQLLNNSQGGRYFQATTTLACHKGTRWQLIRKLQSITAMWYSSPGLGLESDSSHVFWDLDLDLTHPDLNLIFH